jgi:hypothetical protein
VFKGATLFTGEVRGGYDTNPGFSSHFHSFGTVSNGRTFIGTQKRGQGKQIHRAAQTSRLETENKTIWIVITVNQEDEPWVNWGGLGEM